MLVILIKGEISSPYILNNNKSWFRMNEEGCLEGKTSTRTEDGKLMLKLKTFIHLIQQRRLAKNNFFFVSSLLDVFIISCNVYTI